MTAFDRGRIGAVVIGWDPLAAGAVGLEPRLHRLSALGVHSVLASRGPGPHQGFRPPPGPGRLVTVSGDPPRLQDAVAWARDALLGANEPLKVMLVEAAERCPRLVLAVLEEIISAHEGFPPEVDDAAWRLEVRGFDPRREREVESWLTVANGRTGTRGSLEEGSPESLPATYVAAVFGHVDGGLPSPQLIGGPEWIRLRPRAGAQPVGRDQGETVEDRRVLDLRQGILFRRWRQRLASGEEWTFRSARFASLADRDLLALEAEATTDAGPVALDDGVPVPDGQQAVASASTVIDEHRRLITLEGKGGEAASFAVSTDEEAGRLERLVSVHRSWGDDQAVDAAQRLDRAELVGLPTLRARHRLEWRNRWSDADVTIRGDVQLQRAMRFALAHLISSGDPESDVASIGARGLSGPGYGGHVFWDTEVFILPFLAWTHPPTARALLSYRHRTLPAARAKAARLGYSGALYAWESADTGAEVTPPFAWSHDGTRVEIFTGIREHHISADVAWAVWQYWEVTRDAEFLVEKGAEIIVETARFWASRARRGHDGRFHIEGVIGPDEYHEDAVDNAFTNVLARWNLATAGIVCDLLPALDRSGWERLRAGLDLRSAERRWWVEVGEGLVDGFDPESLLYEQFAGFFALEDLRAVDVAPRPFAADTILGAPRVREAQIVKQADVLMLAHMLPDVVPLEVLTANYRYYEPRTSHGSSLSPPVHAAVAARAGSLQDAEHYFRLAAGIDLDNRMGNSALGLHLATMGGLWQAATIGFGGLRAEGECLRLDPRIPRSWEGLGFCVRWRGARVGVDFGRGLLTIDLDGPLTLGLGTAPARQLAPGRLLARREGSGWSALTQVGRTNGTRGGVPDTRRPLT